MKPLPDHKLISATKVGPDAKKRAVAGRLVRVLQRRAREAWEYFSRPPAGRPFRLKSIAVQMIGIHLFGLLLIAGGFLYLSQSGENLIDAHKRLLAVRARILAGTIADTIAENEPEAMGLERRELIPMLRRPTALDGTYARIYGRDGMLITDSNLIHDRIMQIELPPPDAPKKHRGLFVRALDRFSEFLLGGRYRMNKDSDGQHIDSIEQGVSLALHGGEAYLLRRNTQGELVVSFFTPIQPVEQILGVLVLEVSDVDEAIRAERQSILSLFLVAATISFGLMLWLGQAIVRPIQRLADAADVIRLGKKGRPQIPDFSAQKNEIGDLSVALRNMTNALYDRLEAIEQFAADVAHEIKNPLTSLRSAVETFELAKTDDMRTRLIEVIKNDVGRIDRLISDISRASRLDAELARQKTRPVNMRELVSAVANMYGAAKKEADPDLKILADAEPAEGSRDKEKEKAAAERPLMILGMEDRLAQVLNNLIDNAKSFSKPGGTIRIHLRPVGSASRPYIYLTVEDEGPGIPEENLEHIFDRFYTSRPEEHVFGTHSGLGLSICRQIIEAHGGSIRASNRHETAALPAPADKSNTSSAQRAPELEEGRPQSLGARFEILLPAVRLRRIGER